MRVSRVVPILVLFVFLSAGQVPLLPGQAYATHLPGHPPPPCCQIGMCNPRCYCGCSARVQACVDQLIGGDTFTLKTKRSGPVELIADKDVLNQLLDLREKGKVTCGNFTLRLIGGVENMKLMCTKFEPGGPSSKEVEDMTLEFEEAITAMSDPKSFSKSMKH